MSALRPVDPVRAYFDRNVEEWDVLRYRDETYRSRGRLALDWLKDRPGRHLLDLGCGAGHQSVAATRSGHSVVSMDFSFEMARATRDRLQKEVPEVPPRVVVADALHPPFRPGSFDTVVALGLVGFVPDRPKLMRELHTLLQPGGELICDAGLPEERVLFHSLARRSERLLHKLRARSGRAAALAAHAGFYSKAFVKHSPEEFDALLRTGGFEPVSRGGAGFGDLRLFQRPLLPWRLEMAVSRLLSELSRLPWGQGLARRALIHVVRASRRDPSLAGALPGRAAPYASPRPALLFVANYASNTGYAWSTIEMVFRRVGDRLSALGTQPLIAYPSVTSGYPEALRGSSLEVVEFDYGSTGRPIGLLRFVRLLRRRNVRVLYLTDLAGHSWRYPLFRLAGVRSIVLHDRTSGERRSATGVRGALKRILHRAPGLGADCFIGVSEFVADRLVRVGGAPRAQTFRVYNGIDLSRFAPGAASALYDQLELPRGTRIVFCSGRAQEYKGFHILIEAAALLAARGVRDVAYVYSGDGPALARLRTRVRELAIPNFHFLGKRQDVAQLLCSSTIAVVPSLWAEAFGLTVVEAMAAGVPVIGSRTGGIPELIEHGETGLLVEPGDVCELSDALERLLADAQLRERMAARARAVARARFSIDRTAEELYQIVAPRLVPVRSPQERELASTPAQTNPA